MKTAEALQWLEGQKKEATELLIKWASINSWSENPSGLVKMKDVLKQSFSPLADETLEVTLPGLEAKALLFTKRKSSQTQVLLGGHMDTVYPPNSPFQSCQIEGNRLIGPGVADMKGGLVVLYLALLALEKTNPALGWTVIINPDEEIGSPGSRALWKSQAKKASLALLFEPSFPDGAIVTSRKGSISFQLRVTGTPAHAGRDFHKGKSAVKAISSFIQQAYKLSEKYSDLTLNVAGLHSDFPLNVVASEASCMINVRAFDLAALESISQELEHLCLEVGNETGTSFKLNLSQTKQPKRFTKETEDLLNQLESLPGVKLMKRESGGLSDGNILAEEGLPCIDTLGVIGGHLHTPNEYMEIESMIERAKLVFHFLNRFDQG